MKSDKTNKYLTYLSLLLVISQLPLVVYYIHGFINNYLSCPNNDFMSWDPELRFVLTWNMMDNIREFRIFSFLLQILDSPHWPSLRNIVQTIVFFITAPTPNHDIYITVFTLFLVLLASVWIYVKEAKKKNIILVPLFLFVTWTILFRSEEYMLYTFTAMMEVQGSLFFVLTIYFLARLYSDPDFSANKANLWALGISSQLLYHTKYPYGYMLIVSIVFFHMLFYFNETLEYAVAYIMTTKPWKNWRWHAALLFLLLHVLLPVSLQKGKTSGYLKYLIVFPIFVDFFLYFLHTRKEKASAFRIITVIFQWVILPIVVWFLLNPDRLMSSTSQISHFEVQGYLPHQIIRKNADYYFVFIIEFIVSVFPEMGLGIFLLAMNLFLVLWGGWLFYKKREIRNSFYISFIVFLTFLSLSLFTSNRHIRHTFHLYPAMIVAPLLWILETYKNKWSSWLLTFGMALMMTWSFIVAPFEPLQADVCFTGWNPADFTLPRWIRREIPAIVVGDTILINRVDPGNVNKADTEFVIHDYTYTHHYKLLTDPGKKTKITENYKTLLVPGNVCVSEEELGDIRSNVNGRGRKMILERTVQSEHGCIQVFKIE